MDNNKLKNTVDQFLNPKQVRNYSNDGMEREELFSNRRMLHN